MKVQHFPNRPPVVFTRFFKWFCREEYYEDIQGDLDEEFQLLCMEDVNLWRAKKWYCFQILGLLKPSLIKKSKIQQLIERQTIMFRNHFKIGVRNLWKYKSGTAINISGMAIGMAAFILIAIYIKDEISYDRHHEHADEIYRVSVKNFTADGSLSRHWAFASAGHASRLKDDYPMITHATRFYPWAFPDIQCGETKLPSQQVIFADDDVFEIFSFPFIIGQKEHAFEDLYALVLTEQTAIRLYGEDWATKDILGKTVDVSRDGQGAAYKITGVIQDMPENQHFHFEYLAPIRLIENLFGKDEMNNVEGNYNWLTYIRVAPETDMVTFEKNSSEFFDKYINTDDDKPGSAYYAFAFQPLNDIHLYSNLEGEIESNGSINQIYIFGIVGCLLLLVACVNYMNLATSHYSRRMKEVGVRKVVGASLATLVSQFLIESLIVTIVSLPITLILVTFGLPYINVFLDKKLAIDWIRDVQLLGGLAGLILMVGALAGLYPALFLSKINILKSLKGETAIRTSKWNFRSWLVTFQYAVSIALIFVILVIESQLGYIQKSDPGYERNQVLNLALSRNIENKKVFKEELLKIPEVGKVTLSSRIPTGRLMDNMGASFFKDDSLVPTDFRLPIISVDNDFIDTYQIKIIAGSNFSSITDSYKDSIGYYIINRVAAEKLGYQNPQEIIGSKLSYGPFNGSDMKLGTIIGVVENFNFESMHSPIEPILMLQTLEYTRELSLKLKSDNIPQTLEKIETVYAQFDSETTANYKFVDELFDQQYRNEQRLGTMIRVFTMIAIFIGSLGLIGMVGFIIETKTKEIGIRKVLGASVQSILILISSHFFKLIVIAFIIALPLSYWYMSGWLNDFTFRTEISPLIIILPFIITALFTLLTLGYQSLKATYANPVDSLKDE